MTKSILLSIALVFIFVGCSSSKTAVETEFNKPADYWYQQIIKYVKRGSLDKADDAYTSLESEHIASPLVPEAMMILSKAHRAEREYIMSKFYIDRYTKRYATPNNIEFLRFLRIKTNFLTFTKANRDQKLLQDTISEATTYQTRFPRSPYNPYVDTMLTKLHLAELMLNKEIADLYRRTGKETAAKVYEEKVNNSWLKDTKIKEDKSFLKNIF